MLVSVIGGDSRFYYTAQKLADKGYTVLRAADFKQNSSIEQALKAKAIVLPLPVSKDGKTLNAPLYSQRIALDDIISSLDGKQILLGGITKIDYPNYFDYYNNEDFLYKNSVITAEGAIQTALNHTNYSLFDSKCLVIGYGRLGKVLSDRLSAFGCKLTVSARKHTDFEQIAKRGYNCVNSYELINVINDFDIVFNTVPYPLLDSKALNKSKPDTLFIELASKPYGIDMPAAKALGLNIKLEASLPSRCAPKTAGEIIADAVIDIIHAV